MAGFDGHAYQTFLEAVDRVEEMERQLDHLFHEVGVERAPKPEPVDLTPKPTANDALSLLSQLPPAELDRLRAALGQSSVSSKRSKTESTPTDAELVGAEA